MNSAPSWRRHSPEADHGELAGRIAGDTHLAHAAGGRGGDHDAAGAPFAHVGQNRLGQFHDAEDVHVIEPPDFLHAEIFEEAAQSHAGEVNDGVDASGFADDRVHRAIDVGPAGYVHAQRSDFHVPGRGLAAYLLLFGFGQCRSVDTKIAVGQEQGRCQP